MASRPAGRESAASEWPAADGRQCRVMFLHGTRSGHPSQSLTRVNKRSN
jgi:hypothetical protein